jgi:hypothetical protein
MKLDKTTIGAIVVLVCVLAVAGVTYLGGQGGFTLKHGDRTMTFNLQSDSSTRALIARLFENEADRAITVSILRELYDVHEVDVHLVNRLREEDPDSEISKRLRGMLGSFQGPFAQDVHGFRDIYDLATVEEIINMPVDDPVADRLRRYARDQRGIFNPPAVPVRISVSSNVGTEKAAVCFNAEYRNLYIQLWNPKNQEVQVVLFAGNSFQCDGSRVQDNTIQIHREKWIELFNDTPFVEPENAYLFIVPHGYRPLTEIGIL